MVQFNTKDNEILVKIVFYGPSLSGKTTNLQKLHEVMDPGQRTDLFSVNTMEDRTLFFDLLPMDLGYVYGNAIKLQIYTVPGQVHYDSTRRIVLSGADGVVFVADSDPAKLQENVQSINNLYHNLQANRLDIKEVPLVMQYNKRDLSNAISLDILNQKLNFRNVPNFESVAVNGTGVVETFIEAVKITVRYIFEKYQLSKGNISIENVLKKIETSLVTSIRKAPVAAAANKVSQMPTVPDMPNRTVLKYTHNVERDDSEAHDHLLKKAITSNMETARLYTELKRTQDALVKKNDEINLLYKQLEKTNSENLKIRRFLESLVNFAGEAIVTFNDFWVIQNWNQAAEELFGFKRSDVLNQNINFLFPKEVMSDLNRVLNFVTQGKVVRGFETQLKSKKGVLVDIYLTFSPIKNQNGTIVAFTAIIRDLTQMRKINEQFFHLQRYESLSFALPSLFSQIQSQVPTLNGNLVNLMELVNGIAQPEDPVQEMVDINQTLAIVQKLAEPLLTTRRINWQSQLFPRLPALNLNRAQLSQAILNLVLIATDSLNERADGKITVGTHHADGEVLLQMIDNGAGMSHEDLGQIFSAISSEHQGIVGIRLNATREIIKRNGGTLRVDSAPGKGTKVTIRFPAPA